MPHSSPIYQAHLYFVFPKSGFRPSQKQTIKNCIISQGLAMHRAVFPSFLVSKNPFLDFRHNNELRRVLSRCLEHVTTSLRNFQRSWFIRFTPWICYFSTFHDYLSKVVFGGALQLIGATVGHVVKQLSSLGSKGQAIYYENRYFLGPRFITTSFTGVVEFGDLRVGQKAMS